MNKSEIIMDYMKLMADVPEEEREAKLLAIVSLLAEKMGGNEEYVAVVDHLKQNSEVSEEDISDARQDMLNILEDVNSKLDSVNQ